MPRRGEIDGSVPAPARLLGLVARVLLSASLLPVAACSDAPAFTMLFTTEHFVYYAKKGAAPGCDATGRWLERYYSANARFMGATLAPGERMEYYFEPSGVSGQCPPDAGGCESKTTIYSIRELDPHEIVHANAFL